MSENTVWLQSWEESEAHCGTRPDGYSLHLTEEAATEYAEGFMKRQKERMGSETPHEYDRPAGSLYRVSVDDKVLAEITKHGHVRERSNQNMPEVIAGEKKSGWVHDDSK